MKTIPVEQLNERLTKALEQQDEHEAIGLTKDADTVAWVVRVPKALKDSGTDVVLFAEGPTGHVFVVVQAKHILEQKPTGAAQAPVFGAGRGTLTIVSEDDEHLKDFQEYME
ncbi:MAG: hypothetical protein JWN40_1596 [Phycisphaerales bacterium]|nr:hypothetical protein [Phycisphaerales bacterium]